MAAFISGAWQGSATRLPGYNTTLSEAQVRDAVTAILPSLSKTTAAQVGRVLNGEADKLSSSAQFELSGMLDGYLGRS